MSERAEREEIEPDDVEAGGEDDGASVDDAAEAVVHDLEALRSERADLVETLRRVQADFENYRKRVLREQTQLTERATERLLEDLLPVLDSFELALDNVRDADEQVRKGMELVYSELLGVLEKSGLERIESEGLPFDPEQHEAVMQSEGEGEPVVAEAMRTGYRIKDRVLRPAMVRVERG